MQIRKKAERSELIITIKSIHGCLLGCAIGDSVALPFEGLSRTRIQKLATFPIRQSILFGYGFGSDDTDHIIFVSQSLKSSNGDVEVFANFLASKFKAWLLCLPVGIGLATLRSTVKLWLGFNPQKSGVFSAGNAPAMRSAIIGVYYSTDEKLRKEFVRAATQISHTDPKAEYGALAIAEIAARLASSEWRENPSWSQVEIVLRQITSDDEWQQIVSKIEAGCTNKQIEAFLESIYSAKFVSGYVFQTVPFAIAVWYRNFGNFRSTIEDCIRAGGDTDTTAAIAGALAGITAGANAIPKEWKEKYADLAHGADFIARLAQSLSEKESSDVKANTLQLFVKGVLFLFVAIFYVFRRLLPPY